VRQIGQRIEQRERRREGEKERRRERKEGGTKGIYRKEKEKICEQLYASLRLSEECVDLLS
jgi:hypothetical protein